MILLNTNNSWCHRIIFTSMSLICIILVLDYKLTILPIHGILLFTYLFITTVCTAWITFVCLQKLLQSNKPLKHEDSNVLVKMIRVAYDFMYQYVKVVDDCKTHERFNTNMRVQDDSFRKNIDKRIDDFVCDIERRFICKWYTYICDDPTFPSEAKVLIDGVIRHFLQIVVDADDKKLIYGLIIVFLRHVKEFRRTLKRSCKTKGIVEDLYRYSHTGSKSETASKLFIHQLTVNVVQQFINWELWNSLPCRTLVSILSRKLTMFVLTFMSSPGFLNYQIVKMCASESTKLRLKLNDYSYISLSDVDHSLTLQEIQQPIMSSINVKDAHVEKLKLEEALTPNTSPKRFNKKEVNKLTDGVDSTTKQSVNLAEEVADQPAETNTKSDSHVKRSEPVKIHESKSATKTWRNSSDLQCISLGQDLLAFQEFADPNSQIQELIEKKLWKDNTVEDEKSGSVWDIPESWYGEEEAVEVQDVSPPSQIQNYLKSNATTAAIITSTMKPLGNVTANTIHNMKELQQSTVNTVSNVVKPVSQATTNAMHKIGDFQDEAAGVVEGIFDFGMAGLRKGLRLTGLQENFTELTQKAKNEFHSHKLETQKTIDVQKPTYIGKITEAIKIIEKESNKMANCNNHTNVAKLIKTPHVSSEDKLDQQRRSSSDSDELVWVNPLTNTGSPIFEGDILLEKTPDGLPTCRLIDAVVTQEVPQITEDIIEPSPDLEYEETQDFASTIAKLRYLLQQRSSESSLTTPSLSPMPQEELSKTPADPPPNVLTKTDGAMPSLYKFCARTATGVFQNTLNTIKTALPGNVNEQTQDLKYGTSENWTFVETDSMSDDFYSRMKRLLSERRAFCTVDTAYEAIDSLEITDKTDFTWTPPTCQFDDEMDEFDMQVPGTKALVDIVCELISDSNTYLLRESVVKAVLLLVGNYTEQFIDEKSRSLLHLPNKYIGKLPENFNQNVLALKLDEMVDICYEIFPGLVKVIFGETTIKIGLRLFINSVQSQKINQDVFMHMLELVASHLIIACSKASPAYSA